MVSTPSPPTSAPLLSSLRLLLVNGCSSFFLSLENESRTSMSVLCQRTDGGRAVGGRWVVSLMQGMRRSTPRSWQNPDETPEVFPAVLIGDVSPSLTIRSRNIRSSCLMVNPPAEQKSPIEVNVVDGSRLHVMREDKFDGFGQLRLDLGFRCLAAPVGMCLPGRCPSRLPKATF